LQAQDKKDGFLVEIDRLLNEQFRVGMGYHFAEYENDLVSSSGK